MTWSQREQVWIILSDLFLDAEIEPCLPYLERRLRASGYGVGDLDRILIDEVAPLLMANRFSPAGVWDGFDEAWLVSAIRDRAAKRRMIPALSRWWRRRLLRWMVPEWDVLRARLAVER